MPGIRRHDVVATLSTTYLFKTVGVGNKKTVSESFTGDMSKDNHSLGPVIRELVPSPHKRNKLGNRLFCTLRSRDKGISQGVPISYSLGKKLDL